MQRIALALALLFIPSVAAADTFTVCQGDCFTFTIQQGMQLFAGESLLLPVNYDGGVLQGSLYIADSQLDAILEVSGVLSYPVGFQENPDVAWNDQWPYNAQDYMSFLNVDPPAVATPEPSSFFLVGIVALGIMILMNRRFWNMVEANEDESPRVDSRAPLP